MANPTASVVHEETNGRSDHVRMIEIFLIKFLFSLCQKKKMPSFTLPPLQDNPDGAWGPSFSNLPDRFKFKDIPYAPYSKSDKLGRFADWNDPSGENRGQVNVGGLPSTHGSRGGGPGGRNRRDANQAFGSGTASAFAYFHVEDESSFSLVDSKTISARKASGFSRGRGSARSGGGNYAGRGSQRGGRGGYTHGRTGHRGGRRGWRDWDKVCRLYVCKILNLN
jgi:translation initiation factor 3 subunit D